MTLVMKARFPGRCTVCSKTIAAGADIVWTKGAGAKHADPADCAAAAPVPPPPTIDLAPLAAFLGVAHRIGGLKRPKVRVLDADGATELLLSLTSKGRHPGSVAVKRAGLYLGLVTPTGEVFGHLAKDVALMTHLVDVAAAPAKHAKRYAILTSRCSFCDLHLTDDGSVEAGYGPVCAKRYGLPHTPKGTVTPDAVDKPDVGAALGA